MKIIGIILILGALVGGGLILSDTIPGWKRNTEYLERARAELSTQKDPLSRLPANASEAQIEYAMLHANDAVSAVRDAEDGVARRRNETLMFGGGALAVLALGTFLFLKGRKKSSTTPIPRPLPA